MRLADAKSEHSCSEQCFAPLLRSNRREFGGQRLMLKNANHLKGLVIRATDGEIGTVDQLYFDERHGQFAT